MRIGDIPAQWAAGEEDISREDRLAMALLRLAGCACEFPLLRHAFEKDARTANAGPRCKVCSAEVFLDGPTEEQRKARDRKQHLANKKIMAELPNLEENKFFAGLGDCYEGCGCVQDAG